MQMTMKEFKPRYFSSADRFGLIALNLLLLFVLWLFYKSNNLAVFSSWIFLVLAPEFILAFFKMIGRPTKILLSNDEIVVSRFLLPEAVFPFSELTDVGRGSVRFGRRRISLSGMTNSAEFFGLLFGYMDEVNVRPESFEGKLVFEETLRAKAAGKALLPSLFLISLVLLFLVSEHINFVFWWLFLVWIALYLLIFWLNFHFLKRNTNPAHIGSEYEYFRKTYLPRSIPLVRQHSEEAPRKRRTQGDDRAR